MRRSFVGILCLTLVVSCSASESHRFVRPEHATWGTGESSASSTEPDIVARETFSGPDGDYEVRYDDQGRAIVPQQPLPPPEPPGAEPRSRPAPVGPRTITLRHAPLDSAMRMIAEAGRFNLLLEGHLKKPVSVELRGVEPYEALVALAGAHGAFVRYDGQIVIVTAD